MLGAYRSRKMKAVGKAATRHVRHVSRLTRKYVSSAAQAPLPHRVMDFSGGQVGVLFLLLILVASIPIWTHPLPPMADYVNHIARMHVIASGAADQKLSQYYQIDWQIVPNLMMDLIIPVLAKGMSVYLAGQIFTVLMFLIIVSGMLVFNRALFGRWSVLPLVATPLLYNHIYLVGLMNYLFGIGLAMWALASWIYLRERAWLLRYVVATAFVVLTFFCHLFAVGLYGMGLIAYEFWYLWLKRRNPGGGSRPSSARRACRFSSWSRLCWQARPFSLPPRTTGKHRASLRGCCTRSRSIPTWSPSLSRAPLLRLPPGQRPGRLMRLHPVGWPLLFIAIAVYLAMPQKLFGSFIADQRLPIAIAFMMVATVDLRLPQREVRRAFIALVLMLLVVRVIEVNVWWSDLSSITKQFRTSVKRIAPGSKVLVAYADNTSGIDVNDLGLVHAACIAMIERSALVTTAFTVPGKQIMHVRPDFLGMVDTEDDIPPSISQLVIEATRPNTQAIDYWRGWTGKYDYLYVLFTADDAANPDPAHLTLIHDSDRFQLYRIKRPG